MSELHRLHDLLGHRNKAYGQNWTAYNNELKSLFSLAANEICEVLKEAEFVADELAIKHDSPKLKQVIIKLRNVLRE